MYDDFSKLINFEMNGGNREKSNHSNSPFYDQFYFFAFIVALFLIPDTDIGLEPTAHCLITCDFPRILCHLKR